MKELLIELFCEEIPAIMHKDAEIGYKNIFSKFFEKYKIELSNLVVYIGPRRITVHVTGLPEKTKTEKVEIKGPKVGSPDAAIKGFCKANSITQAQLVLQNIKGQDFYFYIQKNAARNLSDLLHEKLMEPITEYVWPKSMYWGNYKIKWVRPLKNILCIFDGNVIPFTFGHLTANNFTYGHRLATISPLEISDFEQYKKALKDHHVILDRLDRINLIKNNLDLAATKLGFKVKEDPNLLEELAGLAEFPVVLSGKIDQKFLQVPSEVLVCSMRVHQKYFSLIDNDGNFAPYFLFVSNVKSDDYKVIINGNEKVLSARLADALYFYNQDLKQPLENNLPKLEKVIFHTKLGNVKDKVTRLQQLCEYIAPTDQEASMAAILCKSDITSEVVGEFPSLQGIMGYYYAKNQNLSENIALAIRNHYKPLGPSDNIPTGGAAILALADKIDSLCGLMIAGEKPTGSKDPYALRRGALGIIHIILDNNLTINLQDLILFAVNQYHKLLDIDQKNIDQIIPFIEERFKYYLKSHFKLSLINAMIDLNKETDLNIIKAKLEIFTDFLGIPENEDLLMIYKRISNITGKIKPSGTIRSELFNSQYEANLFELLKSNSDLINQMLKEQNFAKILQILVRIKQPMNEFFDNIMVKTEDNDISTNRLLLLCAIKDQFNLVANFDYL